MPSGSGRGIVPHFLQKLNPFVVHRPMKIFGAAGSRRQEPSEWPGTRPAAPFQSWVFGQEGGSEWVGIDNGRPRADAEPFRKKPAVVPFAPTLKAC